MEFKPGLTVGIDLGTMFSTLAYLNDEGTPISIEDEQGEQGTPSVLLLADTGQVVVGPNSMRAAMEEPKRIVEFIKRHMGETEEEYTRIVDGRRVTPEFLSALILKKLRMQAEKSLGKKVGNVVITVPYYFNDLRRKATQDAGEIAGLNVIDIINEPTAAALTYAWLHKQLGGKAAGDQTPHKILLYDLGGGTFDATVVRYTPTHFKVLATDGDVYLGGLDWNNRLLDYAAEQFNSEHGMDPRDSEAAAQLLRYQCNLAKIALTDQETATIRCRYKDKTTLVSIDRKTFEDLTADLVQRTLDTAELVLEQSGATADELEAIVLVGGSSLMPAIPRKLELLLGRTTYDDLSPFNTVANGAAIHAAILESKYRKEGGELGEKLMKTLASVEQEDVNSHGLGIVLRDANTDKYVNHIMIPRNTPLPVEKRGSFVTTRDGQTQVRVQVIQGEARDPEACARIGDFYVTNLPKDLPNGSPIEIIYSFDSSGRIDVRTEDKTGGYVETTRIEPSGALNIEKRDVLARLANEFRLD